MKRFKHSLSHYRLLTCDMGRLVPVGMYHVLPGDAVQQSTSLLVRLSPLMAPVMHPVRIQVHHWYVPYRIIWTGWEDFITGKSSTPPPYGALGPAGVPEGSLGDYFGLPTGTGLETANTFPFSAYLAIFNEYYRDQDLQDEFTWGSGGVENGQINWSSEPLRVSWEKDYFTTARPWPQKGGDVTIPLGVTAPVQGTGLAPTFQTADGLLGTQTLRTTGSNTNVVTPNQAATAQDLVWDDAQLVADLSQATAANINDVRRAFALQRYQEARAQYGSRYTEYLRYLGIRPSDARLQRPEYLGGGKATVSFSEVLKTGSQDDPSEPIGTMKGHGISAMRSRRFRRFFEEHGVVISLLSVRPRAMYTSGAQREWLKKTKEDFWQRELEHIGQQEVFNAEVYAKGAGLGDLDTWGYQDRYAEYRHLPSQVSGEFRGTLNYWHLGRLFADRPTLNRDFIECDPGKRIFAEQTQHSLWIMAAHSIQARRMVSKSTVGRIV